MGDTIDAFSCLYAQAAAQEEAEAAAALARGKRSKLKRAKTKYAHQDEEDRQLALEVLAPAGMGAFVSCSWWGCGGLHHWSPTGLYSVQLRSRESLGQLAKVGALSRPTAALLCTVS